MLIKNLELTLLKVNLREGKGKKSGKDYSFLNASVVDSDANVFGFILSEEVVKDEKVRAQLLSVKNVSIKADVEFKPKGFDVGGSIVALTVEK